MMTKTRSNRLHQYEQTTIKHEYFTNDPISFIIWVIALIVFASLYGITIEAEPSLTFFDVLFIIMLVLGLLLGLPFFLWEHYESTSPHRIGLYFMDLKEFNIKYLASFVAGFIAILGIDFGVKAIEALTNIEAFLFFTFSAVAEEFFYRYFIATVMYLVFFRAIKSGETKKVIMSEAIIVIICATISTIVTSTFFYYSHFTSYAGREAALVGIFLCSAMITIVYLYSKSILLAILMHLLVNFIYAAVTYFGSGAVIA